MMTVTLILCVQSRHRPRSNENTISGDILTWVVYTQHNVLCAKCYGNQEMDVEVMLYKQIVSMFVCLLLYVPSQQLWSLRDGQFT